MNFEGGGKIAKRRFCSALLSAFQRISHAFSQPLLDELCLVYGCGDADMRGANSAAGLAQGGGGFQEVRWIEYVRDLGENYLTHAPDFSAGSPRLHGERAATSHIPCGTRGCTKGQVDEAATVIRERLLMKHTTVRDSLRTVDESGDGTMSREEVKFFLRQQNLLKYRDFYTSEVRGELEEIVVDTLLDVVDANRDGMIKYAEFSNVVMAGSN